MKKKLMPKLEDIPYIKQKTFVTLDEFILISGVNMSKAAKIKKMVQDQEPLDMMRTSNVFRLKTAMRFLEEVEGGNQSIVIPQSRKKVATKVA